MPRLAPFLLASTALHAVLLAGGAAGRNIDAGAQRERIAVQLDGAGPSAQTFAQPENAGFSISVPKRANDKGQADTPAAMTVPIAAATIDIAGDPDTRPANPSSTAAARVQAQVLNELTRYFYYPSLARRQGWEGRVTLGFHVADDGRLRDPRVLHSSGFGVLDEAALNSLRKVERVTDGGGAPLDMQIPVVYRLTDAR